MQYCKSVTLRMRDRRNGTKSLFLDFWPGYRNPETMELIRRRSLGMYIYANPISTQQKKYNEAILAKAEAIRCKTKAWFNGSEKGEAAIEIERELAIKFINENIEKDEWLEEYFPKQMEVYHNAIEQTREQLLNQINL